MNSLLQDLRYGIRMLGKAPGFTLVAVITLALGIGANATVFTWLNAIVLRPLPGIPRSEELVEIFSVHGYRAEAGRSESSVSYPEFLDYRAQTRTLAGMVAHDMQPTGFTDGGEAQRLWAEIVSANFFDMLEVQPVLGRGFSAAQEDPGSEPAVVLSHGLWQRQFAGSRDVLGKTVRINSAPFTIVGVAPPGFQGGYTGLGFDIWVPIVHHHLIMPGGSRIQQRGNQWLNVIGRLRAGATAEQVTAELTAITRQPEMARHGGPTEIRAFPLWKSPAGAQSMLGPVLFVLFGVVAVVLLIACANVANLLMARATGRRREMAVRLSVGASRSRLLRQLLTESLLLTLLAGGAAILVAAWSSGLLMFLVPPVNAPVSLQMGFNARIWGFTAALSLLTALVFGLAPALNATRQDLASVLKLEGGTASGRGGWLRNGLVVSQVALSLLLLVSAGLFLRSLRNADTFHPGFNPEGVLLASLDLHSAGYDRERGQAFVDDLLQRARMLPGVESATLSRRVPLGISGSSSTTLEAEGYDPPPDDPAFAYLNWVGPDYFRTLQIPLLHGREFETNDRREAPEVLVVNRTFAERYWPGQNAVGKRIRFGEQWYAVAGVVADSKFRTLQEAPAPFVYLSTTWNYRPDVNLYLRTSSSAPSALAESARNLVRELDAGVPVFDLRTLEEHITAASFQQRMAATLLGVFGVLALLLAAGGVYSVLSYTVGLRTREIGIRMALGAGRSSVFGLVVGQAMRLTATGLLGGVVLALAATRLFSSLLFGVSPTDAATIGAVMLLLGSVALLACLVPARRATRVDPMVALRSE